MRKIVAVTPVFNRRELTLACLESMFTGDLSQTDLHVIVVDDGSTDGTAQALSVRFPQVEVISGDGNLWYSGGNNLGIKAAMRREPDYVLLFNNDSRFHPDCIRRLQDCAECYPSSLVGAVLQDWDHPQNIFQVGFYWDLLNGGLRSPQNQTLDDVPASVFYVETLAGNCALVPTDAIRQSGLMKADVLPHFGDAEYFSRMRRLGWRTLVEPRARVLCQPNTPPPRLSGMTVRQLYKALWSERTNYHNLRLRFSMNMGNAPSVFQGWSSFVIYLVLLGLKSVNLSGRWPNNLREPRLRDRCKTIMQVPNLPASANGSLLFAWPYVQWGGVQVYMFNLIGVARTLGYRTSVLMPSGSPQSIKSRAEKIADEVHYFDGAHDLEAAPNVWTKIVRRIRTAKADRSMLAKIKSVVSGDTIVNIDVGPWSSCRLLVRLANSYRTVVTIHTGLANVSWLRKQLWRLKFGRVFSLSKFRMIAANNDARRSMAPYVEPNQLDQVAVAMTSFDEAAISALDKSATSRAELEHRLDIGPSKFRLVTGGQFIERKGVGDLLHALAELRDNGEAVDCMWISPTKPDLAAILLQPEFNGLMQVWTQTQLNSVGVEYLEAIKKLGDCFILPSHLEGLPLAIVEAMAAGIPCISTSINGIPEAIRNGVNGLLVPPHAPKLLAEAIRTMRDDCDMRCRFAAQGKKDVWDRFEVKRSSRPMFALYNELLDGNCRQ